MEKRTLFQQNKRRYNAAYRLRKKNYKLSTQSKTIYVASFESLPKEALLLTGEYGYVVQGELFNTKAKTMENTISTNTVPNLTPLEIMHYVLLWCYNWTMEDLKIAFKDSRIGWDYYWDKLQGKCAGDDGINSTQAIVELVLNMDEQHQQMLFDFLFDSRYSQQILKRREVISCFKQALEQQKKNEKI